MGIHSLPPVEDWLALLQMDGLEWILHPGETKGLKGTQAIFSADKYPGGYRLRLQVELPPAKTIQRAALQIPVSCSEDDLIFCNGFQSWSESRLFRWNEQLPRLRRIARPLMGYYGDDHIPYIKRGRGYLHSWSWTYRQTGAGPILFLGSLNENQAFSCFQWDRKSGLLTVESDCCGHEPNGSFVALDFLVLSGDLSTVFSAWTNALKLPPVRASHAKGWTSWYRHYTNISEPIILDNLNSFREQAAALAFFQIDDGYQQAIGDWLAIKAAFPNGMRPVAQAIQEAGYQAGIWLAPTVAARQSTQLREHPQWCERLPNGRPLKAGYNPMWGGWFYAFDGQHTGWREYLQQVLHSFTDQWGFSLLKLDFLYATCIFPKPQMTRAQRMRDVLQFIRNTVPDTILLGCGVPLASGFGLLDYCRIGADIHLAWEHRLLQWFRHRERVSTQIALRTVIGRWPLNGRVWRNDPDVYLLRDEDIELSRPERVNIFRLTALLGDLQFTSDDPANYSDWQIEQLQWVIDKKDETVEEIVHLVPDVFGLITTSLLFVTNLSAAPWRGEFQGHKWEVPSHEMKELKRLS